MSNEPASGQTPITTAEAKSGDKKDSQATTTPAIEYDDFGLPIRKPRARTPLADSSESEEEEFTDAVASKVASQEEIAHAPIRTAEPGPPTKEQENIVATETPVLKTEARPESI